MTPIPPGSPDFERWFAAVPGLCVVVAADTPRYTILGATRDYLEAFKLTLAEMLGRPLFEVFPDHENNDSGRGARLVRDSLDRLIVTGRTEVMGVIRYDIGEQERWWSPVNVPLHGPDGRVDQVILRVKDVTGLFQTQAPEDQRPAAERELMALQAELLDRNRELRAINERLQTLNMQLAEREARFSTVFNQAPMFQGLLELDGRIVEGNDLAFYGCGLKPEDHLGRPFWEGGWWNYSDITRDLVRRAVQQAASGSVFRQKSDYRTGDGQLRRVDLVIAPVRDQAGKVFLLYATGIDITEQHERDRALRESQEHFRYTTQTLPNILWMAGPDGKLDFLSDTAARVFGVHISALLREGWLSFVHPDDRERVESRWAHCLQSGEALDTEYRLRGAGGDYRWYKVTGAARCDQAGRILRWYGVATDMEDIKQAQERAESATRAKSAFLSAMSHEIRTPLNAILGYSTLLAETELAPQQREFIDSVRASGDHLLGVINDILDFSRLESGGIALEFAPFDLRQMIESAIDLVASQAARKGLDLAYRIDDDAPASCVGDMTRIRQVLVNLLGNAVKFTEHGEVLVRVSATPLVSGGYDFAFCVQDSGIGIDPAQVDRLFQDFSQVDSSVHRRFGGTGLGLAISRRLVEAHGGVIGVESTPGVGSRFTFRIPAEAGAPALDQSHAPTALHGKRLLIVERHPVTREVLHLQARSWGMEVHEAQTAQEALAIVESGRVPHLALISHEPPDLDGLVLQQSLRARVQSPVVMFAALGAPLEEVRRAVGDAVRVHAKPIRQSTLLNTFTEALFGNSALRRTEFSAAQDAAFASVRVLVVEDMPINRRLMQVMLAKLGIDPVDMAEDGLQALSALATRAYDIVLMDVQMPHMDGLEATRRIRTSLPARRQPQVIALTAHAMAEDRAQCRAAGMDDYLSKPVDATQMAATLRRALARLQRRPEPPPMDLAVPAPPVASTPPIDAATLARLQESFGTEHAAELVQLFSEDVPRRRQELEQALDDGDLIALRRTVHSLKSAADIVGARQLARLCHVLEHDIAQEQVRQVDPQRVMPILQQLDAAHAALRATVPSAS